MVHVCGDSLANSCIHLKSLLTSALERSGNYHLAHMYFTLYVHAAELESLYNLVEWCFKCFLDHPLSSSNRLVCVIFWEASHLCCHNFTGFNTMYVDAYGKQYSDQDWLCADVIHHFRCRPHFVQFLRSEQVQICEMLCTIVTASSFLLYLLSFHCFASYVCAPSVHGVFAKKEKNLIPITNIACPPLIGCAMFCLHRKRKAASVVYCTDLTRTWLSLIRYHDVINHEQSKMAWINLIIHNPGHQNPRLPERFCSPDLFR